MLLGYHPSRIHTGKPVFFLPTPKSAEETFRRLSGDFPVTLPHPLPWITSTALSKPTTLLSHLSIKMAPRLELFILPGALYTRRVLFIFLQRLTYFNPNSKCQWERTEVKIYKDCESEEYSFREDGS